MRTGTRYPFAFCIAGACGFFMLAMNLHGQFPIAFNREQVEPKPPAGLSDKANEDKPLARFLPWLDNTARKKRHALIQITRGPTRLEVENLKDIGIYLQQPLDRHTYTIVLHPEKTGAAPLSTLMYEQTFFHTLARYLPAYKLSREVTRSKSADKNLTFLIYFQPDTSRDRVLNLLDGKNQGKHPWGHANNWIATSTLKEARRLARHDEVYFISFSASPSPLVPAPLPPSPEPDFLDFNPNRKPLTGEIPYPEDNYGTDIEIAIYESNSPNTNHASFLAFEQRKLEPDVTRIFTTLNEPRNILPEPATGVASLAASNGQSKTNGPTTILIPHYRGAAPEARVTCYDRAESGSVDYVGTTTQTYRVSNHSYIQREKSIYDPVCEEVDSIIRSLTNTATAIFNPGITPVWAAGNFGSKGLRDSNSDPQGYYSIISPAKNSICVGMLDEHSGVLSIVSSLGPCLDGRIKPDLVAPGVIDSYTVPMQGRDVASVTNDITYQKAGIGTSFASPLIAGSAALMTYAYDQVATDPCTRLLPSTYKAILVNTATDCIDTIGPPYDNPDFLPAKITTKLFEGPDWASGYGLINPEAACVVIVDTNTWRQSTLNQTGDGRQYELECLTAGVVRVTLCWDDLPANINTDYFSSKLVNDLDAWICPGIGCTTDTDRKYPWTLEVPQPDPRDPYDNIIVQSDQITAAVQDKADHTNNIEQVDFF
ncbi:MAG: hypothetical protein ACI97B_004008, partial [Verrucomicrobiales bacterium]